MNSQPRHGAPSDRGLGCRRWGRLVVRRCLEGRGAQFGWRALAGAVVLIGVVLIGCGRVGDSPLAVAPNESPPNESHAASTPPTPTAADRPTTPTLFAAGSDEMPGTSRLPVTPVAFAETPEESGAVKSATFDDIKFEMKKEDKFKQRMLTDKINGLFDKTIRIRGYILPSFKQNGLTQFVLVRDNMECCFGPGAALYDCIVVHMVEGHTASFSVRPVTVEGKFTFQKLEDPVNGALRAIYHLDGVSVK